MLRFVTGLAAHFFHQRDRDPIGKSLVEFTGDEGEDRSRAVGNDRVFDAVEIGSPRLPVISPQLAAAGAQSATGRQNNPVLSNCRLG
jgi:hypothetical protein